MAFGRILVEQREGFESGEQLPEEGVGAFAIGGIHPIGVLAEGVEERVQEKQIFRPGVAEVQDDLPHGDEYKTRRPQIVGLDILSPGGCQGLPFGWNIRTRPSFFVFPCVHHGETKIDKTETVVRRDENIFFLDIPMGDIVVVEYPDGLQQLCPNVLKDRPQGSLMILQLSAREAGGAGRDPVHQTVEEYAEVFPTGLIDQGKITTPRGAAHTRRMEFRVEAMKIVITDLFQSLVNPSLVLHRLIASLRFRLFYDQGMLTSDNAMRTLAKDRCHVFFFILEKKLK